MRNIRTIHALCTATYGVLLVILEYGLNLPKPPTLYVLDAILWLNTGLLCFPYLRDWVRAKL